MYLLFQSLFISAIILILILNKPIPIRVKIPQHARKGLITTPANIDFDSGSVDPDLVAAIQVCIVYSIHKVMCMYVPRQYKGLLTFIVLDFSSDSE